MAKTFMQMVQEAKAEVPGVSPLEAQRRFQEDPDALLLEVRDAGSFPIDQQAPNMVNISLGMLPTPLSRSWTRPLCSDLDAQTWRCQKSVATLAYKTVQDK